MGVAPGLHSLYSLYAQKNLTNKLFQLQHNISIGKDKIPGEEKGGIGMKQ
jgi:hypothetical protein